MHTMETSGGALFHFNSDLSGFVVVANGVGEEAHVSFADLEEFVKRARPKRKPQPVNPARAAELEKVKADVVAFIEGNAAKAEPLTDLERQMFKVAVNSVKGAR